MYANVSDIIMPIQQAGSKLGKSLMSSNGGGGSGSNGGGDSSGDSSANGGGRKGKQPATEGYKLQSKEEVYREVLKEGFLQKLPPSGNSE